jgi:septum formation protein
MRVILASGSPRRAQILGDLGVAFVTLVPGVDETFDQGESPLGYLDRVVQAKAIAAHDTLAVALALGGPSHEALRAFCSPGPSALLVSDTIVHQDGNVLGKPETEVEHRGFLERLSGREHTVSTGVGLVPLPPARSSAELSAQLSGQSPATFDTAALRKIVVHTRVFFATLTSGEIAHYAGLPEGRDKAGGYAIQGFAGRFIREIRGSYTNVVGLPAHETWTLLGRPCG